MKLAATFLGVVVAVLLTIAMIFTAGWSHPPIVGQQNGYRGTGHGPDHDAQRRGAVEGLPTPFPIRSRRPPRAATALLTSIRTFRC